MSLFFSDTCVGILLKPRLKVCSSRCNNLCLSDYKIICACQQPGSITDLGQLYNKNGLKTHKRASLWFQIFKGIFFLPRPILRENFLVFLSRGAGLFLYSPFCWDMVALWGLSIKLRAHWSCHHWTNHFGAILICSFDFSTQHICQSQIYWSQKMDRYPRVNFPLPLWVCALASVLFSKDSS